MESALVHLSLDVHPSGRALAGFFHPEANPKFGVGPMKYDGFSETRKDPFAYLERAVWVPYLQLYSLDLFPDVCLSRRNVCGPKTLERLGAVMTSFQVLHSQRLYCSICGSP